MLNRRNAPLAAFGCATVIVLALLATTAMTHKSPPTASPPSNGCEGTQLHVHAADAGKDSQDSFGAPVTTPNDLNAVGLQMMSSSCEDPIVNQSARWATKVPGGPSNVDEINKHIAWSMQDPKLRQADHQSLMAWAFSPKATKELVMVPAGQSYWTLAARKVDDGYGVYQTRVKLKQAEPFLKVTTPDGTVTLFKLSCHFQPASLQEFPGIPTSPPTQLPPTGTPPPVHTCAPLCTPATTPTTPTTRPTTCTNCTPTTMPPTCRDTGTCPPTTSPPTTTDGKDPGAGIANNPGAAANGDTGDRPGGPEPSSPPVSSAPPATFAPTPTTAYIPPPVTGPVQPPVTSPVTSPDTAPE